jgi:2-polyprenyl-3-methyl-5-hydroxy-6-metoxy-1,4-benzoquinol methylase
MSSQYSDLAATYREMYQERSASNSFAFTLDFWKDHFATRTVCESAEISGKVLDLGCGTGEIDIWLAREKADIRIDAVDLCAEALEVACAHLAEETADVRKRISFHQSIVESLPFAGNSFDSCFISHTLEHITDHGPIFGEIYRVLKPGAPVTIIVPFDHCHDDPTHVWHFRSKELAAHLSCFGSSVSVSQSPDGTQLAARLTTWRKPRVIGMMRIKNEEEYIEQTLQMAAKVADGFVILDDGSTDRTPELCRSHPKVIRYEYQKEPITDEARDKNRLLGMALDENPDWLLALDGDEVLEDIAPYILRREIASVPPDVTVFTFNFLYMWDNHYSYRVDGRYTNLRHPRLFRVSDLGIDSSALCFTATGNGGNFHCGSVPSNIPGKARHLDLNVKHYGYFSREQRERKLAFYSNLDPVNAAAGNYSHLTGEEGRILLPWRERGALEVRWSDHFTPPACTGSIENGGLPSIRRQDVVSSLIAIVYGHTPMTVGRMFKSALRQLGADFVSVGWFGGDKVGWPTERCYEEEIDIPDIIVDRSHFYKASQILGRVEAQLGVRPAVVLQIDGDVHVCNDLGFQEIRFVTIATDPHLKSMTYGHAAQCSPWFYCMQTPYMGLFSEKARYIPYGYDPEIHFPEPGTEKKYDVACIGFQFPQRVEIANRLREAGLCVRFENGPILDEYRRILSESWICFNISAKDDLNMRSFESLACGTLLVSNVTTDMERFFREGVDYVSYRTPDEAIEKILYYLSNKEELAAIAESGHRAVQGHTYASRLRQIFSEIGFEIPVQEARLQDSGCEGPEAIRPIAELPGYYRHVRSEILAAVPPEARNILDVGCGAGMLGKALKEQDRERKVTGIEINPEAYHYARMNLDEAFHAELESFDPPFRKGQFDCMVFADVLEHLKNPWRTARLYASFLRQGGTFIASIPNIRFLPFLCNLAESGSWKYQDEGILDHTHLRFFTRREFLRLLDFAGIRCDTVTYLGTASCAHLRPTTPERSVKCGNITLTEVSDADFAEMSAFQILFSGSYRPVDRNLQPWLHDAFGAETDFADFARYCSSVDRLYENACQLVREERGDNAILLLKRLLRLAHNHDAAHNDLGLLYYDKSELEKAVEHFAICIRLTPDNSEALKNLASLYVEMGDLGKGIEACREIADLDPKNAESVVNLGNLNFLAGNREDARALYAQALAIDPQNSAASRGMAALGQ